MNDFLYTQRKIEEAEDIQKTETSKTSLAFKIRKTIHETKLEIIIEVLNALVSFLFSILFFVSLYWDTLNLRDF